MCYSTQIVADYRKFRKYVKTFGADIDIHEFVRLYWERQSGSKIKVPKAMGMPFFDPHTDDERRIKTSIDAFHADQIAKLEQDLANENVSRHALERRELAEDEKDENIVLEFKPKLSQDLLVACLWSRSQGKGEPDLLSFAIITADPPPEIAIAGHDRCIVPIKPEHVDAWLNPDPRNLAAQYAILDDPDQPYYQYRIAA